MKSALYTGSVRHRRAGTPSDEFHYPLFMTFLDLDELPALLATSRMLSEHVLAPARFRRSDYFGDAARPLADAIRELARERAGIDADGPIRLLTHLRWFGTCFNPVSFYYCYRPDGETIAAVVAEVTNTPWGERHAYVLDGAEPEDRGTARVLSGNFGKLLHVSPLMGMEQEYDWRLTEPGERLSVHIASHPVTGAGDEGVHFDATLSLRRREMSDAELARMVARYPFLTARIVARIYGHALRLRMRGASWFGHPRQAQVTA